MLKLIWSPEARQELRAILDFISDRNSAAADGLLATINDCSDLLTAHPYMGRRGRIVGTREAVVHPNYILIYEIEPEAVRIRSVVHSRREYPPTEPE